MGDRNSGNRPQHKKNLEKINMTFQIKKEKAVI